MKRLLLFIEIAGVSWGVVTATAQISFRASLAPMPPTPVNFNIPARAAFSLDGSLVSFAISVGIELSGAAPPTTARLGGINAEFTFDLGVPSVVVHFPLPWPPEPWQFDYGAGTSFGGTFPLPDNLREDFVNGRTTLVLLGGTVGDFRGRVLPDSPPLIEGLEWQGTSFGVHFTAEPPYRYTVQYRDSVGVTNWSDLGEVGAVSQPFEALVMDSATKSGARFYQIRRELLADLRLEGIVGQAFVEGYCHVIAPGIDCSPRPFPSSLGVLSTSGELIARFTTAADGRFHISLSAGDYALVFLHPLGWPYPAWVAAPVTAKVKPRELTTVIMTYDAHIF